MIKAWCVTTTDPDRRNGGFIEVYRDKGAARRKVRALLDNGAWRKATDYAIDRVMVPKGRCFDAR